MRVAIALAIALMGPLPGRDCHAARGAGRAAPLPSLPADSVAARESFIRDRPAAAFAALYDSLLAASRGPLDRSFLAWAGDYLSVTGDSLLLRDCRVVAGLSRPLRAAWLSGVTADREAAALQAAKQYPAAAARFGDAVRLYRSAGDLRREAVALGSQGVALWYAGDLKAAGDVYLEALQTRRRLGDPVLIGRTLNALGSVAQQTGDYGTALDYYDQARRVREACGDRGGLATTLAYIGNVHSLLGRLEEAQGDYERSIETLGPEAKSAALYPARLGLANVCVALGDHRRALAIYESVLAGQLEAGDNRKIAQTRRNIAVALWGLGDYAGALHELEQARPLQEKEGDRYELAATLNHAGVIQLELGDQPRALKSFQEAAAIAAGSGNDVVLSRALINTGLAYSDLGLHEKALEVYERARGIQAKLGDPATAQDLLIAMAYSKRGQGKDEDALALDREALASAEAGAGGYRGTLALIEIGGTLARLHRFEESRSDLTRALNGAAEAGQVDMFWRACVNLADCYEREGRLDSASAYNRKAIEAIERERNPDLPDAARAAYLEERLVAYESEVQVLAGLAERAGNGAPPPAPSGRASPAVEAFQVAEQGKARGLLDLLSEGHVDMDAGVDSALTARRRDVDRRIKAAQYRIRLLQENGAAKDSLNAALKGLARLEDEYAGVLGEIRFQNPRLATIDAARTASIDEVRTGLLDSRGSAGLLEFAVSDSGSFGWFLTGNDRTPAMFRLPGRRTLEAAVQKLRAALADPSGAGRPAVGEGSRELGRMLLGPVADRTAKVQSLYIVPDGALNFVPFEALSVQLSPEHDGSAPVYALRGKTVCYGPSATALLALKAQKAAAGSRGAAALDLLALGDPVFSARDSSGSAPRQRQSLPDSAAPALRAGLAPLPHTREEVNRIAAFYAPERRTVLLGAEAREKTLVDPGFLARYRVIHLATHGLVDERRPDRSALALSLPQDPGEDGYLQAAEIYRLKLNADLVVLSACETGLGRMVRGEGVLGLPRAFLFAGTSAVLVSLWSVSDRSTAEFMAAFYREMAGRHRSPAEALARTKALFQKSEEFSSPFHWAPFVLIGTR